MDPKQPHSRSLIIATVILIFLVIIAFVASFLTAQIKNRIASQNSQQSPLSTTPTPKERGIYIDLPATFPRDLPLPQEAKVAISREDQNGWTANLSVFGTLEEAERFYLKELPNAGWAITSQSRAAGLTIVYARKGKQDAVIAIGKGEQGVTVSITILKNP